MGNKIFKLLIVLALVTSSAVRVEVSFAGNLDSVAIVGAGPAGITAALELQKKGYQKVELFESSNQVGGKVESVQHEGNTFELGAVVFADNYSHMIKYAKELGIPMGSSPRSFDVYEDGSVHSVYEFMNEKYGLAQTTAAAFRYSQYVLQHPDYFKPGFSTPNDPDLALGFEEFSIKYGMGPLSDILRTVMVGCGYGYMEEIPAMHWLKLMRTWTHDANVHMITHPFSKGFYHIFPSGWQQLFTQLVKSYHLNVHLNTAVDQIERLHTADGKLVIRVSANGKTQDFDRIIITVPYFAGKYMHLTSDEEAVFSKVQFVPYQTTLAKISGLPETSKKSHFWFRHNSYAQDNQGNSNIGKLLLLSNTTGSDYYMAYQFSQGKTDFELEQSLTAEIKQIGGKVLEIAESRKFEYYFPHFSSKDIAEGVIAQLQSLQGKEATYYTGALMNFETVRFASEHAEDLVEQYF